MRFSPDDGVNVLSGRPIHSPGKRSATGIFPEALLSTCPGDKTARGHSPGKR
ncbi:hypothetical protein ATN83_4586 [Raoultella ornithinolytica]|nr:hypothetical protein ATN83_4586 [Raoultella ornithinolytica]